VTRLWKLSERVEGKRLPPRTELVWKIHEELAGADQAVEIV
jgi:hypothetical protein